MSEHPYLVDTDSLRRVIPLHLDVPPLLIDFAAWLHGRPWGTVGCFDLVGQFAEQAPIVDGSLLRKDLALFFHLPEGSAVGAWCQPGVSLDESPIVVLGSEGQHQVIAASLAGMLARIALRRFEDGDWTDFAPHEDGEDSTAELADWLKQRLGLATLNQLADRAAVAPDFARWMGQWCDDREAYWDCHPLMAELGRLLTAHRPSAQNPWDRTWFEVAIVGAQFQVRVLRRGRQPIDEAPEIEPMLRRLRDDMWREQPDLGLWFGVRLALRADGCILPDFDYETRPMFDERPADRAEAQTELSRAPRPARWIPPWLAEA